MFYQIGSFGILNTDKSVDEPLVLLDGGIERRHKEVYDFDNRLRKDYSGCLFQYTLQGSGCFEKNGVLHELGEHMGFFIRVPDESRYYLPEGSDIAWEFIYLHFDGEAAVPFIKRLEALGGSPFCLPLSSEPVNAALMMQRRMMEGYRPKPYEGGEFLYHFLGSLMRELAAPSDRKGNSLIEGAVKIIESEYQTLESIDALALRLGVSPAHLTRSFKQETGTLPVRFLTQRRLQAAIFDLLNTGDTLEAIAMRNGFSCGNYFCKVFRSHVGETPTEYRSRRKG